MRKSLHRNQTVGRKGTVSEAQTSGLRLLPAPHEQSPRYHSAITSRPYSSESTPSALDPASLSRELSTDE